MNRTEDILCKLLNAELWGENFELEVTPQELSSVLKVAEQQTVFSLVFNSLAKSILRLDKNILFHALIVQKNISLQNEQINQEMVEFFKQMDMHQMNYIVMKGQTIAALYPHPEARMPGDVDFLIKENYEFAREKFRTWWGISLPSKTKYEKDISFLRNRVNYEIHTFLITFGSSKNSIYWNNLVLDSWSLNYYIDILGSKVRILPPTINAVYIFLHLFFHFVREGVGLRQFCDWAVLLNYYYKEINVSQLKEILLKLGMLKAYKALGTIIVNNIGLHEDRFPFLLEVEDVKWGKKIFQDVIKCGNFGQNNHQIKHLGWRYKMETAYVALQNVLKYYPLASKDLGPYLFKCIKGNVILVLRSLVK